MHWLAISAAAAGGARTTFVGPAPTPLLVVPSGETVFGVPLHPEEAIRCAVPCALALAPGSWRVRAGDAWTGRWTTIESGPSPATFTVRPMEPAQYAIGVVAAGMGCGLAAAAFSDLVVRGAFGLEPSPSTPWLAGGGLALTVGGAALGFTARPAIRPLR